MNLNFDPNSIELDLMALADGELDAAGLLRVQKYLTSQQQDLSQNSSSDLPLSTPSPEVTKNLIDTELMAIGSLLLKDHLRKAVCAQTPPVSAELKNQITQMLAVAPTAATTESTADAAPALSLTEPMTANQESVTVTSRWKMATRWVPAGLAAMFVLGMLSTLSLQSRNNKNQPSETLVIDDTKRAPSTDPVNVPSNDPANDGYDGYDGYDDLFDSQIFATPVAHKYSSSNQNGLAPMSHTPLLATSPQPVVAYAQLSSDRIDAFSKRHNTCSKKLDRLYQSSNFPQEVEIMPLAIANSLKSEQPRGSLDLSLEGYLFSKAGECGLPGQDSVHMVYRTKARDDSVSLWVLAYTGKPELQEGVLYQGDPADSPHPIFFWRQDELLYYMVGNSFEHTRKAAQNLQLASK